MSKLLEINTPLGEGKVVLTELSGREYLGQLPEYSLTFVADHPNISANDLLAHDVTIGLELNTQGDLRYFNGFITSLADAGWVEGNYFGAASKAYIYRATMHPWLWFLTRRSNCRIFQDKTVPEIIEEIFKVYPFAAFERKLTSGAYRKWEYCCQYRETDFNFVCRLMEQEGIYFWFDHTDGKHVMQLCDGPSSHGPKTGHETIPFDLSTSGARAEDSLVSWHSVLRVQSGRFSTTAYNFKTPQADLTVRASKTGEYPLNNFEMFDFGEEYEDRDQGDKYAKLRSEEIAARHEIFAGDCTVRALAAGQTFTGSGHTREGFNKEYLIIGGTFSATNNQQGAGSSSTGAAEFRGDIEAIDSRVFYRAPRSTPKPVIAGPQSAVVVGPGSDEISTDEHGRVKVQFFWDRYSDGNENSSCAIRVSQPIAGKEWGAMFLPRIGQEVIVEFFEGDPDRPVITGRLYNADAKPPWDLPANKTRSGFKTRTEQGGTSNFNELRFEDKQGSEEIYIHAEKDNTIRVKNDQVAYIGNDAHLKIVNDRIESAGNDHHLKVKADHNVDIGDSYSLNVKQDWQAKTGGKFALESTGDIHLKGNNIVIEVMSQLTLKDQSGNFINFGPMMNIVGSSMVNINSGGSAGSGSGSSPDAPKDPKEAADSQGGGELVVKRPTKPEEYSPQATALKLAHQTGAPFCAQCAAAAAAQSSGGSTGSSPAP